MGDTSALDCCNWGRKLLDDVRYADAVDYVYHCIWDDVADWYLEASKGFGRAGHAGVGARDMSQIGPSVCAICDRTIWTTLKFEQTLLIRSPGQKRCRLDDIAAAEFDRLRELVVETRYVAAELPGKQTMLYERDTLIEDNRGLIARLARLDDVRHVVQPRAASCGAKP